MRSEERTALLAAAGLKQPIQAFLWIDNAIAFTLVFSVVTTWPVGSLPVLCASRVHLQRDFHVAKLYRIEIKLVKNVFNSRCTRFSEHTYCV